MTRTINALVAFCFVLALCFATFTIVGEAAGQTVTGQYKTELVPRDFKADVVLEQRLLVNKVLTVDGGCVGCQTGIGSASYDFPALSSVVGGVTCAESFAISVPGSTWGDGCDPATNLGMDGGAVLLTEAQLTCRAAVDSAYAKLCVSFTDGGVYNLGDAGFTLRTHR